MAYAVDVREGQATFDLRFEAGARYWVILGSLADHDEETGISLSAEKITSVERFPLRPLSPLPTDLPRRWDTSWPSFEIRDESLPTTPFVPQGVPPNASQSPVPIEREFYLHVTDGPLNDARQYAKVASRSVAEGRFVRVFLDAASQNRPTGPRVVAGNRGVVR